MPYAKAAIFPDLDIDPCDCLPGAGRQVVSIYHSLAGFAFTDCFY
jgi:hypothetical protein